MDSLNITLQNTSLSDNKQLDKQVIENRMQEEQNRAVTKEEKDLVSKSWLSREMDMYEAALILEESEQTRKSFVSLAKKAKGNSLFYKEENGKLVARSRFEIKETKEEIARYSSTFAEEKQRLKIEECKKYFKARIASDYKSFNISETEIEQFVRDELAVKSITQVKAELDCVKPGEFFKKEETLVPVNQNQINEYGASGQIQHLPAIVAKKIVAESKGFVTMVKNEDGSYRLRPSLPSNEYIHKMKTERAIIPKEIGITNLRETYNLYCKFYAHCLTNGMKALLMDERKQFDVFSYDSHFLTKNKDGSFNLKEQIAGILTELGATEDNINDFKNFLIIIHQDESAFKGVTEFQTGAIGAYVLKSEAIKKLATIGGFEEEKAKYIEHYDELVEALTDEEKQQLLGGERLTGKALDKRVSEICKDFVKQVEMAKAELAEISKMDISSPEIALFGACSANGMFMKKVLENNSADKELMLGYQALEHGSRFEKHGLEDLQYRRLFLESELKDTSLDEKTQGDYQSSLDAIVQFLDRFARGEVEFDINSEEVQAVCKKAYEKMSTFNHHAAAVVYENDEFVITTEAFAAETNQFMVSPLQRGSSYVGIYRKKPGDRQYGFINYYGEDIGANYGIRQLKEDMIRKLAAGIRV